MVVDGNIITGRGPAAAIPFAFEILKQIAPEKVEEIKKAMLSCSESAIFLCDKNKIGKIGVPRISGLDGIDCFITDAQLTDEWQVALAEQDVKLVEVEK